MDACQPVYAVGFRKADTVREFGEALRRRGLGSSSRAYLIQVVRDGRGTTKDSRVFCACSSPDALLELQYRLLAHKSLSDLGVPAPLHDAAGVKAIAEIPDESTGPRKLVIDSEMTTLEAKHIPLTVEDIRLLMLDTPTVLHDLLVHLGYVDPAVEIEVAVKEGTRKVSGVGWKVSMHFVFQAEIPFRQYAELGKAIAAERQKAIACVQDLSALEGETRLPRRALTMRAWDPCVFLNSRQMIFTTFSQKTIAQQPSRPLMTVTLRGERDGAGKFVSAVARRQVPDDGAVWRGGEGHPTFLGPTPLAQLDYSEVLRALGTMSIVAPNPSSVPVGLRGGAGRKRGAANGASSCGGGIAAGGAKKSCGGEAATGGGDFWAHVAEHLPADVRSEFLPCLGSHFQPVPDTPISRLPMDLEVGTCRVFRASGNRFAMCASRMGHVPFAGHHRHRSNNTHFCIGRTLHGEGGEWRLYARCMDNDCQDHDVRAHPSCARVSLKHLTQPPPPRSARGPSGTGTPPSTCTRPPAAGHRRRHPTRPQPIWSAHSPR